MRAAEPQSGRLSAGGAVVNGACTLSGGEQRKVDVRATAAERVDGSDLEFVSEAAANRLLHFRPI